MPTTPRFDSDAPMLILAPHLEYPPRNGADLSLDRIGQFFSAYVPYVDIVAKNLMVRYEQEAETRRESFENAFRSKVGAALRTVVLRSHFYLEKFITPTYADTARRYLRDPAYKTVLCSYITTTRLVTQTPGLPAGRINMIWSHNDEFKWFRDLGRSSKNPFAKLAARFSERWLHGFFRRYERDFLFLHVTEADRDGFAQHYPDHASALIPIGVDLAPFEPEPLPPQTEPVWLMFVGALGVKMNLDALLHFDEVYYPVLKQHLGDAVDVLIVGSTPSKGVVQLCRERGWSLRPNVTDEELDELFGRATFAILPFGYATGAKLKLLNALAHGVPFLATEKVGAQSDACIHPSLLADDPAAWLVRINEIREQGISAETRQALRAIAEGYSWKASAARLHEVLAEERGRMGR